MKLTKGTQNLGLPDYMKIGLELEVENLDYKAITKKVKEMKWHCDKDASLTDEGTECVSPVLKESENKSIWQEVEKVCEYIKECPADPKREPYTDYTCGGHIHFDAGIFKENPQIMNNFLRLWAESEELVYKMCNDKNDPIRSGAMNTSDLTISDVLKTAIKSPLPSKENRPESYTPKTIIGLARDTLRNFKANQTNANRKLNVILADALMSRDGMSAPVSSKIQKQLEARKTKIRKTKIEIL